MQIEGKRFSRTRLIARGRYVVSVEVEMVVPAEDDSEPCYEPETVQLLRQVAERAARRRRLASPSWQGLRTS